MLAIIDYEAGNQTSVARALTYLGIPNTITASPQALLQAQGIIFPGVGAAGQAMSALRHGGLDRALAEVVAKGIPLLGICLGCQILLSHSEENATITLGIVPGECKRFDAALCEENGTPVRIPHMGWNSLTIHKDSTLLRGLAPDAEFYFVHSYYAVPPVEMRIASTLYGVEFCAVYGREGLWAAQFHVEKSGRPGLSILKNFYEYCQGGNHAQ